MTAVQLPTQAQIVRAVKAAMQGAHDMGYRVSAYKITFSQGVPSVDVTLGAESPPPLPVVTGGVDVEALKIHLGGLDAARRS